MTLMITALTVQPDLVNVVNDAIAPRPMATPDEQQRLLSLPYNTLTPKQKSRVRYYRRQQRLQQREQSSQPQSDAHVQQQAQLVASRFTNTSHATTTSPIMSAPPMDSLLHISHYLI